MFDSPVQIAMIIGVIVLLFGGSKLPQLAKSIGQSRRAFKEGMLEAEADESAESNKLASNAAAPQISQISDESLMEEMRRRVDAKQV